ncbi:hypothetical protein [Corynebacterium lizhenjunii]|uniref:hypothetical protein n=1 Tax=Corynebacterium lizhenjunii TaxID=2709394 RepID=UPI0013E9D386|nr:hypothetical protein [Corynebacterium lizhenjunii]
MTEQKSDSIGKAQIISASATLLGTGIAWTLVVIYRLHVKEIEGEWGNLLLASGGLGFGCSALYVAFLQRKRLILFITMGGLTSIFLLVALAFYSGAL